MRGYRSTVLLACCGFLGGVITGPLVRADTLDPYPSLDVFARVLGYIERSYIEPVPMQRLIRAAIHGIVSELDGPSGYLDPEAFAALREEARPDFGGVGVVMTVQDERVVIVEVHPETPARRAGLQPGDELLLVDGWSVLGQRPARIVSRIVGVPGTSLTLTVQPIGGDAPRSVRLARTRIYRSTVTSRRFGAFGYLRLLRFDERTSRDVLRALDGVAEGDRLAGLVLDLRGNPGGLLEQAVAVANVWLENGAIVSTDGRNRDTETLMALADGTQAGYPVAVLVDGQTASAAEIVAGALQDQRRGRIFGHRTFGKGSVQTLIELGDGSALKLTVARYLTPSGRSIDGRGIEPDVPLPEQSPSFRLGDPALDEPLSRALDWLSESSRLSWRSRREGHATPERATRSAR